MGASCTARDLEVREAREPRELLRVHQVHERADLAPRARAAGAKQASRAAQPGGSTALMACSYMKDVSNDAHLCEGCSEWCALT